MAAQSGELSERDLQQVASAPSRTAARKWHSALGGLRFHPNERAQDVLLFHGYADLTWARSFHAIAA